MGPIYLVPWLNSTEFKRVDGMNFSTFTTLTMFGGSDNLLGDITF